MKIPVVLIVGPKDVEANEVSIRIHDDKADGGSREEKVALSKLSDFIRGL